MHITAESWDFCGPSPGLDHLKMIEDYISNFLTSLENLIFTWLGRKGPCLIALAADPLFTLPRSSQELFHEVTSLIFDFENTFLLDDGSWDDALAPLIGNGSHSGCWSRHSTTTFTEEFANVRPKYFSDDLTEPSAAVEAVSQELLDIDLGAGEVEAKAEDQQDAARKANLLSNKFMKRYMTKRRRRRKPSHDHDAVGEEQRQHRGQRSKDSLDNPRDGHHRHHLHRYRKSQDALDEHPALLHPNNGRQPSTGSLYRSQEPPRFSIAYQSPLPQLAGEGDRSEPDLTHLLTDKECDSLVDEYLRPRTPTSPAPQKDISAPILFPSPNLLQPTVYEPTAELCSGTSAVQCDIKAEGKDRLVAEDVNVQVNAWRQAKEIVLSRLGREFCSGGGVGGMCGKGYGDRSPKEETFGSPGFLGTARFSEGLFGESTRGVSETPHLVQDHRSMDVPILLSRD
ncbi:Uu.00g134500.m01.CDS01 [Anthostomella pinea]|uniref:Uu.00g134500.m01.CDS01 n=1 Tax=Anthostomella pinea TaxID=933095 RepID=A0AAI8VNX9_9PEZI|nr:Uu.00g134500.m01.CDS01 [Anthostomella pinea]